MVHILADQNELILLDPSWKSLQQLFDKLICCVTPRKTNPRCLSDVAH